MKVFLRLLAAAGAVALAAGDMAAPPPTGVDRVTLQLNWLPEPEFGGIYEAARSGAFARRALDVTILKGGPDVPAVQMAAAGRVDFAIAAADEVVSLREKGADVVALFATYQTSPQAIMVRASRDVKDIPALLRAGGVLIAQPGLAYLKHLRKAYGLAGTKIVPYGSGAMAQFLDPARRDVAMQCFVFAEPLAARRNGVETRVFLVADTGFDPYTAVVITSGVALRRNPAVAARLVAALREGWTAYLANPAPANEVMARLNPSMDLATFADAAAAQRPLLESAETHAHGLGAMRLERWQTLAAQLLDLGIVERPVAPEACFVNP